MKQIINPGKGLLWNLEHPAEICPEEITIDFLLKLTNANEMDI